jgi:(hydroxyamino)benzene mutase
MTARHLYRHGFGVILLSLLLGFAIPASGGGAKGRLWLAAHTTGLMTGLLVVAAGCVWPTLRLGPRARKVAGFALITGAWLGYWVLGVFNAAMAIPLPIAAPGLPAAPGWTQAVLGFGLIYVGLAIIAGTAMVLFGLRNQAPSGNVEGA